MKLEAFLDDDIVPLRFNTRLGKKAGRLDANELGRSREREEHRQRVMQQKPLGQISPQNFRGAP